MKKVLFLFGVMSVINVFSQEFSQDLTNIVPPSPTASSLGKYGEIPVSYNVGLPSIGIPLYEINSSGINVPISLNYHASGVRVEDNASWVGLGWSLNAGGVITRSVRGMPDDSPNGLRNNNLPTEAAINDITQTTNIIQYFGPQASPDGVGVKDREPDLFYYNFMGSSGKLYFDEDNNIVSKPYSNSKVEPIFLGGEIDTWVITNQTGIQYYFGTNNNTISGLGKEITATGSQPSFTSAWYLTKIFNPKTNTNIYFEYEDNTSMVDKPKNQSLEWYFVQPIFTLPEFNGLNILPVNPEFESPSSAKTTVYGNRVLKRILFSNGRIEFTTTANRTDIENEIELSKIEIFNDADQLIKSYVFNYDYVGKLYLDEIKEYDKATQEYKSYTFEYQSKIPNGAKYDQDFWGFYNAAGNTNLIPTISAVNNPYGQYQADRLPNEVTMKRGVLKKITYPTKGSTEFFFEAHKAFTPKFYDPYSPFLLNNKKDISLTSTQGVYKEELFSIETQENQNILFDIDFSNFREEYNTNRPAVYLQKYENGAWIEIRSWWPSYPSLEDESFDTSIELSPGDYKFILTDMPCVLEPCYVALPEELEKRFVTYAKFSYLQNSDTDLKNTEITAGGLRIQKIVNKDTDGAIIDQKKYTYEQGKLITFPIHYSYYDQEMYNAGYYNVPLGCWAATSIGEYQIHTISSSSMAVLGASQGSHVIYSKVIEEKIDANDQNNGSIEYQYYVPDALENPDNTPSEPPFAPQDDISDIANKLKKQIIFNRYGDTLQKITYDYSFISPEIPSHTVKGLSILKKRNRVQAPPDVCTGYIDQEQSYYFHYAFYDVETSWIKLNATTTTDFDINVGNPVVTTTEYFYENNIHLQPTKTKTTTSDGKIVTTKTYYPDDIIGVNSLSGSESLTANEFNAIQQLNKNNAHRLTETIQVETIIDGHKTAQRTNYKAWTDINLTLPEFVQTSKGTTVLQDRITYKNYDAKANPVEVSKANGIVISYIWGYYKEYPVAKIENATYAEIAIALGLSGTAAVKALNETNLLAINSLRENLSNAMVTTYTYDPLIGMTSMTDPKGYTTYYKYDNFNRLKEVRDQDNILLTDYKYHYKN